MKIIQGNLLRIEKGIICHQVNCLGAMGAGLALALRKKYPLAYRDYIRAFDNGKLQLGEVIYSKINNDLIVANLCGQFRYGTDKQYTDYDAVRKCILNVTEYRNENYPEFNIYIPYLMGCALGGGDWNVVTDIIDNIDPDITAIRL
jgi:O-acetyl-ADP-ribose deacetylase (regulator of RNase III)